MSPSLAQRETAMVVLWGPEREGCLATVCRKGGTPDVLGELLLRGFGDPFPYICFPYLWLTYEAWSLSKDRKVEDAIEGFPFILTPFELRFGLWPKDVTNRTGRHSLGLHSKESMRGPDHVYLWDAYAGVWLYRDHRVPNESIPPEYDYGGRGRVNPDAFLPLNQSVIERYRRASLRRP